MNFNHMYKITEASGLAQLMYPKAIAIGRELILPLQIFALFFLLDQVSSTLTLNVASSLVPSLPSHYKISFSLVHLWHCACSPPIAFIMFS